MFERIVYCPRSLNGQQFDIGTFAELLFFFGRIELLVGEGGFRAVLAHFSIDELNDLQEAQLLRVSILREVLAVHSSSKSGRRRYDFITAEKWAGSQPARARSAEEIVRESLAAIGLAPGKARRSASRFLRSGTVQSVSEGMDHENGISELSRRDAFDQPYMREVAEAVLVSLDYPFRNRPWRFVVHPVESGFEIDTDLDFDSLSRTVSAMRREKVQFTPAHLVDVVQDVRFDLHSSAMYSAAVAGSEVAAQIQRIRLARSLQKSKRSELESIADFQAVTLEGRSIGEALRSGRKGVRELLELLDRGQRFKGWLHQREPSAELLRDYVKELSEQSWLSGTPGRILRFFVSSLAPLAVGAIAGPEAGALAGFGAGAANDFLVDRLVGGWRPSQFVREELVPFVERS